MRASRKGFTFIELLLVVVVIGILATIAMAKFTKIKEESFVASMKADLRNLAVYEMNYYIDSRGFYFSGDGVAQGFSATPGVTITATAVPGPPASWSATATHSKTSRTCSMITTGSNWDISCS